MTSCEAKLRTLAQQDATMQTHFGDGGIFRFFDRQLPPGYLVIGKSCARVFRISTTRLYAHETDVNRSQNAQSYVRLQIDILDYDAERARAAANAVIDWLGTVVDLSSNDQFGSPVVTPPRHPAQILNQRAGMEYKIQPPAYVETLDVRVINSEE